MGLLARSTRPVTEETAMPETATNTAAAWPEGIIARYLTVGGAAVDVTDNDRPDARCGGCPQNFIENSRYISGSLDTAHVWANDHATACRAMPRPA